jgi:glycine/D-amino acid oxidase-like deaminating enzyme
MSSASSQYDVVVVGAGVIGCGIAQQLAPDHDVAVLDKGAVAGEASGFSAGLIAPTLFYPDLPSVARHANGFFREFDGTGEFSFTQRRRIELITEAEEDRARSLADLIQRQDLPAKFLEVDDVEREYPWFDTSDFVGGLQIGDAGWIDPYTFTTALKRDAESQGTTVETNTEVTGLEVTDGHVTGVRTENGTVNGSKVVFASGWRTRDLLDDHLTVPVKPYRLQCVTLEPETDLPEDFPLARIANEELYMRPEHNGDLLVGGGEYIETEPERVSRGISETEEFRNQVASVIPRVVDGFDRAEFVDGWIGVDSCTPDGRPIIDEPGPGPDGLFVATGFNGLGMVNSPIAPAIIRALVTGEESPIPTDPFSYDRVGSYSPDFDLQSNSNFDIIESALSS